MPATMAAHADTTIVSETAVKRPFSLRRLLMVRKKTRTAVVFGILSTGMYFLLYHFNADIRALGESVSRGDKTFFLMPIGLAFAFSIVHGIFTDRFWEAVGLKAKR